MMCKPLRNWREVAPKVRGRALDHGHFLPEEAPKAMMRALRRFPARV